MTTGRTLLTLALGLALTLAGSSCAPGGYYNTSQSALDSLLTSQAALAKRIDNMEKKLDMTREGAAASRAATDTRLLEISQRLDVLDGKLDESGARVSLLSMKVDTVKQKINTSDSTRAGTATPAPKADPEAMYQAAYSDIAAGRYALARESFQTLLKTYPDTEVADNAQYWIGESYYGTGDFANAIVEFQKVLDNYPKGDKVPAAMFKMGLSQARLKQTAESQKTYRALIQKYPKSPEAALAKERLGQKS
jgi:tol-pal system protein YbgF